MRKWLPKSSRSTGRNLLFSDFQMTNGRLNSYSAPLLDRTSANAFEPAPFGTP